MRFEHVARLLQGQVDDGRVPGCVAAVRHGDRTEVIAVGRTSVDGGRPMEPDTLFRLASVTKPLGGALALALVEDGVLGLDDGIARWLPEFAEPRVTARRGGPLDETVPAERPLTVRDLLTFTAGLGWAPDIGPLADAMDERGVGPSGFPPELAPDEYLERLAGLPLSAQPGATWNYHTCSDVLGVLLARATGRSVGELLAERVTGPLGLTDTAFVAVDPARLAVQYWPEEGGLKEVDGQDGVFARPPRFESLSSGLVSTAPDVLAFLTAIASGGGPVLPAASAAAMTRDALTPEQRAPVQDFLGAGRSWGLHVGVDVEAVRPWQTPGRWGWDGGTGTSAWADPSRDLAAVLLTQRFMLGADDEPTGFWAAVHRSV
ncbi:serine hydrolase domain-containing protein [Geodermatophilus sp. SYSU D00691]